MKSGFTLVELLVTISIFIVITSVAVLSNNQFNSSILLTDLGYEVALSVRQSQVFGITVKAPTSCVSSSGSCVFTSGYGVHFDISAPSQYILFEDKGPTPDHIYEGGAGELLETYNIGRGYTLKRLCVNGHSASTLDISFVRPEPEAWVSVGGALAALTEADIYVQDPQKISDREIIIAPTGQISVQNSDANLCN